MNPLFHRRTGRKSPRPFDLLLGIAVAGALLWIGTTVRADFGKDRLPLETLVPPETLAVLSFPDIGKAKEAWKTTALYKIWEDSEVQHAVDTLLGNVEEYRKQMEEQFKGETGVELEKATEVFSGQFSLALIAFPDPEGGGAPIPKAAFALDFGERKEELDKLVAWMTKNLKAQSRGMEEGEWDADGVKVNLLADPDFSLHYLVAGPTFLAATDKAVMEGMLKCARDANLPSLSNSDDFKKTMAEVSVEGKPTFLMYANVPGLIATLEKMTGQDEASQAQMKKVLDATGIRGLKAVGVGVSIKDEGILDRVYLHAPGARQGVLSVLTPGVTAMPTLPMVPADAVSYSAFRVDLASAWDRGFEVLKQVDEETWKQVTETITNFEKDAGVMIRADLLGSLGKEVSSWGAFPEGGGLIPYSVTAVALKDPVAFEATLERLYAATGMERREVEWMDRKIRYFVASMAEDRKVEGPPGRGMPGMIPGLGPAEMVIFNLTSLSAYFIEGGTLYMSNLVQTLKTFLRGRGAANKKRLMETEGFKALQAKLPPDPGIVIYMDLEKTFSLIYNSLLPFAPYAEIFVRRQLNFPFETAALPTARAIGQHLEPAISGIADRPGGVLISSYSNTGVTTAAFFGVGAAAVGAALFLPLRMVESRTGANEASAIGSLKAICVGQEQFKNAVSVDLNMNGVGEYGFLQELGGTSACRTPGGLDGPTYAASPFIPRILGIADPSGKVTKSGYHFRVFLPGKDAAVNTGREVPAGDKTTAARQEISFCAYAWPVAWGKTGRRVFFINEMGQVFTTIAPMYSGDNGPPAQAAFSPKGGNPKNLDAPVADGEEGSDGNMWMPVG
ncbi:MAG: DUF2950 family protein [Planctomycetota bacterium]|jgi:hypothetical protein